MAGLHRVPASTIATLALLACGSGEEGERTGSGLDTSSVTLSAVPTTQETAETTGAATGSASQTSGPIPTAT